MRRSFSEATSAGVNPVRAFLGSWEISGSAGQRVIKEHPLKMYWVLNDDAVQLKEFRPRIDSLPRANVTTYTHDQINRHCPGFRWKPAPGQEKQKGTVTNSDDLYNPPPKEI